MHAVGADQRVAGDALAAREMQRDGAAVIVEAGRARAQRALDQQVRTAAETKGVELVIAQLARTNPKAKGQTPETLRVFEPSILDELKKSGFIDKARR